MQQHHQLSSRGGAPAAASQQHLPPSPSPQWQQQQGHWQQQQQQGNWQQQQVEDDDDNCDDDFDDDDDMDEEEDDDDSPLHKDENPSPNSTKTQQPGAAALPSPTSNMNCAPSRRGSSAQKQPCSKRTRTASEDGCTGPPFGPLSEHALSAPAKAARPRKSLQQKMPRSYPPATASHEAIIADPGLFHRLLRALHEAMGSRYRVPWVVGRELDLHLLYKQVPWWGGEFA